jgi:uncharacterized protein DUF6912
MRVYLASTLPLLARAKAARALTDGAVTAYAVTPTLREWYAEGDLEELEYAAMTAAARASLGLLADDPDAPRRRVVLAADVPEAWVRQSPGVDLDERAEVTVAEPVPWSALASIHVDGYEAEPVVEAATQAVRAAAQGDEDARFTVDGAEDESLLWYAVQEAEDLLAGPGAAAAEG